MDKLKDLFLKNIGLKIISLVAAILLWIVSMNINNPQMTQTYTIPITIQNLSHVNDSGMVVLNESELVKTQVYVKIKATRNDLLALDTARLTANIDFSPVDITNRKNIGKSVPVSITVNAPSISYEIVDYSPKTVNVTFDELTTKDVPVELNQTGKPAKNFEVSGTTVVSPETVTVKGAKTYVDQIEKAEVYADIEGAQSSINEQFTIHILDKEGNDFTNMFSLSSQSANVNITIKRVDSILVGTPKWEGELQEGYKVVDVTWSPKYIDVIGDEDTIASISFLELPPINVTGASADVTQVYDLKELLEPMGLKVQEGASTECTVTVKIEQVVTKIIDVPTKNINFINAEEGQVESLTMPENIQVTVTGPNSEILNLDPATLNCVADFANYKVGDSGIEVDVTCSNLLIEVQSPVRLSVVAQS